MPMRRTMLATLLLSLTALCVSASTATAGPNLQRLYDSLVTRLKAGDTTVSFLELRIAHTGTANYKSQGLEDEEHEMFDALVAGNTELAIEKAKIVLEKNYVSLRAHFVLDMAYRKLKMEKESRFHSVVATGLIQSILASGDGTSTQTAWQVISPTEQSFLINWWGFELISTTTIPENGHMYEMMKVVRKGTPGTTPLYFNVDIPTLHRERQAGK